MGIRVLDYLAIANSSLAWIAPHRFINALVSLESFSSRGHGEKTI